MKAVFLAFLFTWLAATAQDSKTAHTFTGCYELKPAGWLSSVRLYHDEYLPRRFQLTMRHINNGLEVKNLDSNVRQDLRLSAWNVKDERKVEIVWSTGFVGWSIQLSGSDADFRGTAQFFTDTDTQPSSPITIVTHAVNCKGLAN